ncbi:MAG: hypothetical protein QXR45_09120 [Candidatus Bathyarchaeia archaeon]
MNLSKKWFSTALILAVILAFPLIQTSSVYADNSNAQPKTLSLLSDVVMLDLTSYDVKLLYHDVSYSPEYEGMPEEVVRCLLEAEGSKLDVTCKYINGTFIYCLIEVLERSRSPIYHEPLSADLLERTRTVLKSFQKWSGSPRYRGLENLLDRVNKLENTTVRLDNLKLSIFTEGELVHFGWTHVYKFGEYELEVDGLFLDFRNDDLWGLGDCYSIYKVGSDVVNVSRDEAVRMARERAETFSWKVGLEPNATEVRASKILDEPVKASLSLRMREPLTLYPHWQIALYFDRTYPGFVIGVEVGIWADTGEIHYINPISTGGGLPPQDSSTPSPEPEPEPSPKPNFSNTGLPMEYIYAIVVIIAVTVASAIGYLHLKRKNQKPHFHGNPSHNLCIFSSRFLW